MKNLSTAILLPCLMALAVVAGGAACQAKAPSIGGGSVGLARQQIAQGNYIQAIKTLEEAVRTSPRDAESHLLLGQAYLKAKRFEDSRDELRTAMRLGKGSSVSQNANRAMMLLPGRVVAPISGDKSRFVTAALQLMFMQRTMQRAMKQPMVVDFRAGWAQPCQKIAPVIDRAKIQYGERITFVTVDIDDPENRKIVDQYQVSTVPTLIFIDPKGEVVSHTVGPMDDAALENEIKKLL